MTSAIARHESLPLPLPGKRMLFAALAVAVIAALGFLLRSKALAPAFLHINAVQVYGELRWVDREKLKEAVQPYLDSNFFGADLSGIKHSVESLPWVASSSVRRQWPNQLHITIREHRAVARWKDNMLINEKGGLFEPAEIPQELAGALVQLQGPENSHQELFAMFRELQPLFEKPASRNQGPAGGLKIAAVYLNERRALTIELASGMRIIFGRMSANMDSYNAASRFFRALAGGLNEKAGQIAAVDLRYTNGFAVQWKDGREAQH